MIIPVFSRVLINKDKVLSIDIPLSLNSDYRHQAVVSDSFFVSWFDNFDNPVLRHVPVSELSPFIQTAISNFLADSPKTEFLLGDNLEIKLYDIISLTFEESYQLTFTYQPGWYPHLYSASGYFYVGVDIEPDDLYTDLYPDLLDNNETKLSLEDWIADDGSQRWNTLTDKDVKAMDLIEKYNKNVLLLRSTRKVKASINGSITTSSNNSVNLSGVENNLQNINNSLDNIKDNLQYTDTDDVTKGLAQIEFEKDNSVLVQNNMVESAPNNPYIHTNDLFEG